MENNELPSEVMGEVDDGLSSEVVSDTKHRINGGLMTAIGVFTLLLGSLGFSVYGNSGLRLMDKEAGAAIKERFLSAVEVTALQSGCAEKVKAISNSLELWAISAEACGDFEGKMKSACEDFVTEEILACGGKGE